MAHGADPAQRGVQHPGGVRFLRNEKNAKPRRGALHG